VGGARTAPLARPSFPDGARHGSRHEVLESIGSGQSSSRERSRWERSQRSRHRRATSNPWPVEPRLAISRKRDRPSAARNVPERARPSGEKLHQRATAGVVLRSSDIRGRVRGSFRLQKSTGGARHRSPTREERADHERCLVILRESKGWRTGPGSRLPRGKARGTVTGSQPISGMGSGESTGPGSTCRWKASRVVASCRL
jgi:hypothetical protein